MIYTHEQLIAQTIYQLKTTYIQVMNISNAKSVLYFDFADFLDSLYDMEWDWFKHYDKTEMVTIYKLVSHSVKITDVVSTMYGYAVVERPRSAKFGELRFFLEAAILLKQELPQLIEMSKKSYAEQVIIEERTVYNMIDDAVKATEEESGKPQCTCEENHCGDRSVCKGECGCWTCEQAYVNYLDKLDRGE